MKVNEASFTVVLSTNNLNYSELVSKNSHHDEPYIPGAIKHQILYLRPV